MVFILRRMVEQATEWQIPTFVMDCDVAAAFDHVSHHVIIDAMEALSVPPVLVAAWVRKYMEVRNICQAGRHHDSRNSSNTFGATNGTRALLTCLGQHWTFRQQHFGRGARRRRGSCPLARATGALAFCRQLLDHRDVASRTQMHGSCTE